MSNITGMSVATPTTVYAWPKTREEFDLLALPEITHEWKPDNIKKGMERRCISKATSRVGCGEMMVIFQWFEERHLST